MVNTAQTYKKSLSPCNRLFSQKGPKVVDVPRGGTYNADHGGYESSLVVTVLPSTVR